MTEKQVPGEPKYYKEVYPWLFVNAVVALALVGVCVVVLGALAPSALVIGCN